jgi:hypothetical protein
MPYPSSTRFRLSMGLQTRCISLILIEFSQFFRFLYKISKNLKKRLDNGCEPCYFPLELQQDRQRTCPAVSEKRSSEMTQDQVVASNPSPLPLKKSEQIFFYSSNSPLPKCNIHKNPPDCRKGSSIMGSHCVIEMAKSQSNQTRIFSQRKKA